jgi:alpha-beta hydrolase superfamily lysophospholipase
LEPLEIRSVTGRKRPIFFGAPERPLFGFYHPPAEGVPRRDTAVVLCAPIGTDHVRSDWTYRSLAERLASAGFACLRFDLSGTGDSADGGGGARVREWIDDIGRAVDEVRARSGAGAVSLFGLRLGATLALAHAAERGAVDSLVLWSPCVSGAGFLAEISRLHALYTRIEPHVAKAAPPPAGSTEALGLILPRALVDDLSTIDLLETAGRPARRALVVDGGGVAHRDALVARLRGAGVETDVQTHSGHKFLVTVSHRQVLPEEPIASIVRWLDAVHPERSTTAGARDDGDAARAILAGPAGERPIVFGSDHPLFGIFTPANAARSASGRPAIVVANAGCVNRQGPHAMFTALARRWAGLGFDVLRVDLAGIGDSPAAHGTKENLTYPPSGLDDLSEAMLATGRERAIVVGLCSGGDYAFQLGARACSTGALPAYERVGAHGAPARSQAAGGTARAPAVAGAWILNPRTFCVLDLTAVESGAPPSTPVAEVPRLLGSMAERGIDTTLIVSRGDPGVAYVDQHAAAQMQALAEASSSAGHPAKDAFARFDLEGADHPFTPVSVQARVGDLLTERLAARH